MKSGGGERASVGALPDRDGRTARDAIGESALKLGFLGLGVARAGAPADAGRFDAWLDGGLHGEMAYMRRRAPERRNPDLLLPGARTVLSLAANYFSGNGLAQDPLRGRISRYAWGEDYHKIVLDRLERLEAEIRRLLPGALTRSYVDTGPVLEKVWAARTALGWQGKHSNLLALGRGSWFFLGVILLDRVLPEDEPAKDHCGTCVRCIHACPTGAIVAPYVVDARLCVSYLTIEHRGVIPRPLRPLIGNRIFGCDDCQEVCPWNRFAVPCAEPGFLPRAGNLMPELAPLVDLGPDAFRERFRGSPVLRARRDGFVRNVAVALGNSHLEEALGPLARALKDASPLVRAHAAWAVAEIGGAAARKLLREAAARETDPLVLGELDPYPDEDAAPR